MNQLGGVPLKLFHLSDLHLGRRLFEFSLIEDQSYIIGRILELAKNERPDVVVIAGDIYDRSMPSVEAVRLLDDMLNGFSELGIETLIISGNHDSPERVSFGGRLMEPSGIHIAPVFDGKPEVVTMTDKLGEVDFWLLPFIKPASVRRFFPDAELETTNDALRAVMETVKPDPTHRNILVAHQFVTGAERSESEELSVGGSDNVDVSLLEGFDYVALGHIHRPQSIAPNVRYCGSPLKYSFSEAAYGKSVTMVTLGKKGEIETTLLPLVPLHELRELRGSFAGLTQPERYEKHRGDYVHIVLTDEEDIPDAAAKLRLCYPGLMKLSFDNTRTGSAAELEAAVDERSPLELFGDFYRLQNGHELSDKQLELMKELIGRIFE